MELARRGDFPSAISTGEAAVRDAPDDGGLRLFIGLLHARQADPRRAVPHLRSAAALIPDHPLPRLELARALIAVDQLDEAEAVVRGTSIAGVAAIELIRLKALIRQRQGDYRNAADFYRVATMKDERDFESWANLGLCLLALGDAGRALVCLKRALALRPDQLALRLKLADAEAAAGQAGRGLEEARAEAEAAPQDPLVRVVIARLEDLSGRPEAAETALEEALALDPACAPALIALAGLLERRNRIEAMGALLMRCDRAGIPKPETALLRARLLYRRGDLDGALAAARSAPDKAEAGARAQLIGQIGDRLGDHTAAFAAFAEMNRRTAAEIADAGRMAERYRATIAALMRLTTPGWYRGWSADRPSSKRAAPVFLVGFPRSGTTLLDTMLMGHPDTLVLEERPVLHTVRESLGSIERLPDLDRAAIDGLRALYFAELDRIVPDAGKRLVIDKVPLGIVDTALIHRIFPDARFIFAERHPCDVVLSCFMTRFDPRGGMANFLDLGDTARLYDLVLGYWWICREVFPLDVHEVRYERIIEDAESILRPLTTFLGLDWSPELTDHCRTASKRAYIATPSYSQVAEPLYTRGRWERYRDEMAPVLPILAPWAERMGYSV